MRKRFAGRRDRALAIALLLLLLLALPSWKALRVLDASQRVQRETAAALATVAELQSEPSGGPARLVALGRAAERTSEALAALQAEVGPLAPLLRVARPLPPEIGWPADVPDLLSVAVPLARAGAIAAQPISEAAEAAASAPPQEHLRLYLRAAATLSGQQGQIEGCLAAAEAGLQPLRGKILGGPLRQYQPFLDGLEGTLPQARRGLELLGALGPALGMEGPRSYLLLGQNNAEIRATGGFIGSVGLITVENGAVVRLEYGSSYTVDDKARPPLPPAPLARYLGLGGWYLRDANWWPDFPASAAQVEEAWRRAGHGPVDGVVAIDTTAVEGLLRVVGPVEVSGFGPVSADGFEKAAAEQLYSRAALASATAFHEAKNAFLGAVSRAVVDRLLDLSPADLLPLGSEIGRLLREKHLLLAAKDQRLLQVIHANGWDGAFPEVSGDSLCVVDTTVSYGDTYSFVDAETSLRINLAEDGSQQHEIVLSYSNHYPRGLPSWIPPAMVGGATFDPSAGKLAETPGFWGDWLRVYVPPDARSVTVDGLVDPAPPETEFGRTVVAGYLPVGPGEHRTVVLRYVTGAENGEKEGSYHLFVQKQAGSQGRSISVLVRWPTGESAVYRGSATSDLRIELRGGDSRDGSGDSSDGG